LVNISKFGQTCKKKDVASEAVFEENQIVNWGERYRFLIQYGVSPQKAKAKKNNLFCLAGFFQFREQFFHRERFEEISADPHF
jgi:hypothetical protein